MVSSGRSGPEMPLTSHVPPCRSRRPPTTMSSTLSPTDFDSLEIQGQYSDINNRWDLPDSDWDNDSSSARLFERSRIKALAGEVRGGPGEMLRRLGRETSQGESSKVTGRPTFFLSCQLIQITPSSPWSPTAVPRTNFIQSKMFPIFPSPSIGLSSVPLCP